MDQLFVPDLGLVVGHNVTRLRTERGWTQRELIERLNLADPGAGPQWSSASLSLLENRGARGERLSDLAALCSVFGVALWALLDNVDDRLDVETQSGTFRTIGWITSALRGEHDGPGGDS